jgi:hypothetical protein
MKKVGLTLILAVGGCATASPVMDLGDGTYSISAQAAPARGGATGATTYAFEKATAYCAPGRPVLVHAQERNLPQGYINPYGGGMYNAGSTAIRFRCNRATQ